MGLLVRFAGKTTATESGEHFTAVGVPAILGDDVIEHADPPVTLADRIVLPPLLANDAGDATNAETDGAGVLLCGATEAAASKDSEGRVAAPLETLGTARMAAELHTASPTIRQAR